MKQEIEFGHSSADILNVGDIVSWSKYCSDANDWVEHFGILVSIENQVRAERLVSVSRVIPLDNSAQELEFFTITLRLVSQTSKENKT